MMARYSFQYNSFGSPNRVFQLLVLYRWLSLVPLIVFLLSGPADVGQFIFVLVAAVIPNLVITLYSTQLNRLLRRFPWLLLVDLLTVAGLIALSGGWQSPFYLYALNPLIAAAFFFGLRGALIATTAFAPLYLAAVVFNWQTTGQPPNWLTAAINLIGLFLISGTFGYVAILLSQLRQTGDALRLSHQNLNVLHTITADLHQAVNVNAVVERVLLSLTQELGFRQAAMGLLVESGQEISQWLVQARDDEPPAYPCIRHATHLPLTNEGGMMARAVREGIVFRLSNEEGSNDTWLDDMFGFQSYLIVPLMWGMQPIGILLVDAGGWDVDKTQQASVEAIAQQTAVAIGMMQTRLRRARESAIQAERGRIALDIHDTVSQSLFGIVFTLDGSLKLLDNDPEAARPELEWALQTAEEVRQEIRRTIQEMWSEELSAEAFESELRRYTQDTLQSNSLLIQFDIRGDFDTLSPRTRRSLYRITQECLTNVVQHAAATESRVCLDIENGRARLVVRDDGRGFEPEIALKQDREYEHFGLCGMQDRARSLGGTCDIFSHPDAGTSIVVNIPTRATKANV